MRRQRSQPLRPPALPMHHRSHRCIRRAHRLHSALSLVRRVLDLEQSEPIRSGLVVAPRDNITRRGGGPPSQLRRIVHYRHCTVTNRNTRIPSVDALPTPNTTTTDLYPPLDANIIEPRIWSVVTTVTDGHSQANMRLGTSSNPRGRLSHTRDHDSRYFQRLHQALNWHLNCRSN